MAASNCSTELNQQQNLSGCPDDAELVLFIAASGYSGYSGYRIRDWGTTKYCLSGYSGYSGFSGVGTSGYSGFSGNNESGYSGYSGFSGESISGYSGELGRAGTSGYSGVDGGGSGHSGYSGYSGGIGVSGFSGVSGYSGGAQGTSGFSGYSGFSGLNGSQSWKAMVSSAYDAVGVTASTTTYGQIMGHTTFEPEVNKQYVISESCLVEKLYIKTSGTQPISGDLIVTVRKNFTNTLLQITISAGSSATVYSNIVNTVLLAQGDVLTLQYQNLATSTSIVILSSVVSLIKA